MSRRLLLVAQGAAIGLVVLLFALLLWKLVDDDSGAIASATARGERPPAPEFTLERLDRGGDLALSSLRGKAVVLELLGFVVHPVQGGGAIPRGGLAGCPR